MMSLRFLLPHHSGENSGKDSPASTAPDVWWRAKAELEHFVLFMGRPSHGHLVYSV